MPGVKRGQRVTGRIISIDLYGYPARLIADWCGVTLRTAKRWKAGRAMPEPARRLVHLNIERRLLPSGWLYNARTGELVLPDYDLAITLEQLRAELVLRHMTSTPTRERSTG